MVWQMTNLSRARTRAGGGRSRSRSACRTRSSRTRMTGRTRYGARLSPRLSGCPARFSRRSGGSTSGAATISAAVPPSASTASSAAARPTPGMSSGATTSRTTTGSVSSTCTSRTSEGSGWPSRKPGSDRSRQPRSARPSSACARRSRLRLPPVRRGPSASATTPYLLGPASASPLLHWHGPGYAPHLSRAMLYYCRRFSM